MYEHFLNNLPLDDLLALMVKSSEELSEMSKFSSNRLAVELKHKEVELIQKVIAAKRAEFPPVNDREFKQFNI